jgi:hypothetical protein
MLGNERFVRRGGPRTAKVVSWRPEAGVCMCSKHVQAQGGLFKLQLAQARTKIVDELARV